MLIKFHKIFILTVLLSQSPTQVNAVQGTIARLGFGLGRRAAAANGGPARIGKLVQKEAQVASNGGRQQMAKPQVAPKGRHNPLLQTEKPLKNVPPPSNATLARRAADALSLRVSRLSAQIKKVKQKAYFGLDQMAPHGNEVVYIAEALTGKVDAQMMRRMLTYTGKKIYNGIWRGSKAVQRLPFRTRVTLFGIALIADIGHTIDEYWQLHLQSKIAPHQIGIGVPRNLQEFASGLNNFWWDAWPDFAFGVPLVFFGLNPPLLILTQTYKTLFEYVFKKVYGEALKDYVWPSEFAPVLALNKFMDKQVPVEKVYDPDEDEDDDNHDNPAETAGIAEEMAKMEAEKNEEANSGDTKTVTQALLDSQKDSNFYQYFGLNSMRSMYVFAVAIQVEYFNVLESAPEDNLTDLAKESKSKMNEKMVKETKEIFQKEMVQKVVNLSNKAHEKMDTGKREQILKEKAEIFEKEIKPRLDSIPVENEHLKNKIDALNDEIKAEGKSTKMRLKLVEMMAMAQQKLDSNVSENANLKKKIDEINVEINAQMDSEMKPMLLKMAKATAQRMAFKRVEASPDEEEFNDFTTTLAYLISDASTTEGLMRTAMLDAKNLEQRKLPEEDYEQPKVVDGNLIFPQCSKEIREYTMMANEAQQKRGQDFENYMKSLGHPMPKFINKIHSGSKAKRWATPYCSILSEAGQILQNSGIRIRSEYGIDFNGKGLSQSGTKSTIDLIDVSKVRVVAFPVYPEEVVKKLAVLSLGHKVITIQRAAKMMLKNRRSVNKIGHQPVQKNTEKVGITDGNGVLVVKEDEVLQKV